MGYSHDFTGLTEKVQCTSPVLWRQFENVLAAYWEASGEVQGQGYYVSANPRLSVFFSDVSSIKVLGSEQSRSLARAIYVPAGMQLRTSFTETVAFSHLDIHLDFAWAVQFLSASLPRSAAVSLLERPAECDDIADLQGIALLLAEELRMSKRHTIYAESLAASLLAGVLDIDAMDQDPVNARLTASQMRKVVARFEDGGGKRLTIAQMAEAVSLSESWFSQVFKNTTGVTPHQWQLNRRVEEARGLLSNSELTVADIADRLGFSDQAHLTKSFRQLVGETPAAWRRSNRAR